jgi:hypothetical protein
LYPALGAPQDGASLLNHTFQVALNLLDTDLARPDGRNPNGEARRP